MILYKGLWFVLQAIMKLYWRLSYEGGEHVPRHEAFVLAPVHRSFLDFALVTCITRRRLCFMAKESIWKWPLTNKFFYALGAFPVQRGGADREAMRRSEAVVQRGEPVVMFPEGTRRSGPAVVDLFEGPAYVAARNGVPILPVGIGGSERAMKRGKRVPRPVKIHLVVGPPIYPPARAEGERVPRRVVRELTEQTRVEVQRLFDLAQDRVGVNREAPPAVD